jgi:peptidoglycan L-alanyl-D-glutamate endopeptidase CwlK
VSAGDAATAAAAEPTIIRSLDALAPIFRANVEAAVAACLAAGLDAKIAETSRTHATAVLYYARGRTIIPPSEPVTNAIDETYTWHGYGLAVDVISTEYEWFDNEAAVKAWPKSAARETAANAWFAKVAATFKAHGCKWGGDWTHPDLPHHQHAACKPSPSDVARTLLRTQGVQAVWRAVGAMT